MTIVAIAGFAAAFYWLAVKRDEKLSRAIGAMVVGLAVGLGWVLTFQLSQTLFDPVQVSSVSFTGPATDTLMGLVNSSSLPFTFGSGVVPGVFVGSGVMALLTGELKIQRFGRDTPMERYLVGAALMGFGAMLAGGCAVGAGVSGGAIFATTAWVAVFCMWVGAIVTHRIMLGAGRPAAPAV